MAKMKTPWIVRYFRESFIELQKVVWPSQETVRKHTILVIAISLFVAVYFAASDYVLNFALESLI